MKKLYAFIFCILSYSCAVPKPYNPIESFIFIQNKISLSYCLNNICKNVKSKKTGSAFVIKNKNNNSYILTAGHICEKPFKLTEFDEANIPDSKINSFNTEIELTDINNNTINPKLIKIININEKKDLCMIQINNKILPSIKISNTKSKISDVAMTISAPKGFFYKNLVFITKGYYLGSYKEHDMYSIFTLPGSSGAMILNNKKELIGIALMGIKENTMISISINYKNLIDYINKYTK